MNNIVIEGIGAVSPGGWGSQSLWNAVQNQWQTVHKTDSVRVLTVPKPDELPPSFRMPRLRRASVIGRFGVFAAMEALEDAAMEMESIGRLGILFCTTNASVHYTKRFYQEVLNDPGLASPLIFPETVFNAPSSHLSSLLGHTGMNYTLVGDSPVVAQALAMGSGWLLDGRVDTVLVVAAEEHDPVISDAMRVFCHNRIISEGAGALVLRKGGETLPRLSRITDPHSHTSTDRLYHPAKRMAEQLCEGDVTGLLCHGMTGNTSVDALEAAAWKDWKGERLAPKTILGEAFTASAMWQCVMAVARMREGRTKVANVSLVGLYDSSIGVQFISDS